MKKKRGWFNYLADSVIGVILIVSVVAVINGVAGDNAKSSNNNVVATSPLADYSGDNAPYSIIEGGEQPGGSESTYTDVGSKYSNETEAGISQPDVDDGVKPDSKELDSNVSDNIKPDSTEAVNSETEEHSSQTEYPVSEEKKSEVPLSEKKADGQEIEISFDEFQ